MRGAKKKNLKSKRGSFSNVDDPKFAAIKKETEYLVKYRKIAQSFFDDNELIDLFKKHNYEDEQILKEINNKIRLGEDYQWKEIIKGKAITAKSSDQAKHKKKYYREEKSYSPEESKEQIIYNKNQKGIHKNSKDFYHYIAKKPKRPFQKCIEVPSEYQPTNINEDETKSKKEKTENNKNNENKEDNKNNENIENSQNIENNENNEDNKIKENNENNNEKIENNENDNNINDIAKNLDITENIVCSKVSEKLITKVVLNEDENDSKSKELKLKEDAFRSLKNARKNWKRKSQADINNNTINTNINISKYISDNNTSNNISNNLSNDISNNNIINDISNNNISFNISNNISTNRQNEETEDFNNTPPGPEISSYSEIQKEKRKREKYLRDFFVNMKKQYCRKDQNNIKRATSKDSDISNKQIENIHINNKNNTYITKKNYKNSAINKNNSNSIKKKLIFDEELQLDTKVNNLTISSCYDNPYREQYLKMIKEKKKQNPDKVIELIVPPPIQYNPSYMQLYSPYQYGYNPYMNINPNIYMMKQYQMSGQQILNPLNQQQTPIKLNKPQNNNNKIDNNPINNVNYNEFNQGIMQSINANMISPRMNMAPSPVQMEINMGNVDINQLSVSGSGSGSVFHNISNDRVWEPSSSPGGMINTST